MRITNNMLIGNMEYNLNQSLNRMEMLQYQTYSGKKFRVPSDDPIGTSKALKLKTDISKVEQYRRNTDDALSWMRETESALDEVSNILHRTNVLVNQAANETNSKEDLEKIEAEIDELRKSLIKIGNTSYGGRYIFSGHDTNKALFDEEGKYNIDIAAGNEEIFQYNIGQAERVEVNTLGGKVFGKGDNISIDEEIAEGNESYLIGLFENISKNLKERDTEKLQQNLGHISEVRENILSLTSTIGARSNRLELTQEKLEDQNLNLENLLSKVENISLPEAYMQLQLEKNVYNASLSVGSQIIQPSLVDFIR